MGSHRLPGKMLLDLGGMTLIERGFQACVAAFGRENVVAAIPDNDEQAPLVAELGRIGCRIFAWKGDESDVLSRMYYCASTFRWHPQSIIFRSTSDDPFKSPELMKRVARGERHPVELGGEAFTLEMLGQAHWREMSTVNRLPEREHLSDVLFTVPAPAAPVGRTWTVDTPADLAAARAQSTDAALNPWSGERCIP